MKDDSKEQGNNSNKVKSNNNEKPEVLSKSQVAVSQGKEQKPKAQIIFNVKEVRYPVIKRIARHSFGMKLTRCKNPDDDWDVLWTDQVFSAEKLQGMKPYQSINHFPGMYLIALKHNLAKYLKLMQKAFPEEFKFFPRTWIAPYELFDLNNHISQRKTPLTMIVKPQNQCQGKGIFITRKVDDIPKDKCHVVQQYQTQPYLIDEKKFDLRIYVLVTQVEPHLTCFIYKDGLARFATEAYNSTPVNNGNLFMHLTNYAINKTSEKFSENEADYKKRLVDIYQILESQGHDVVDLQKQINDIIIKTLMSIQPQLSHMYKTCSPNHAEYRTCFELLGFDIFLDKKLKPWLLEVNHAPSFNDDTEVDKIVKTALITDTFRLLDFRVSNKTRILNREKNIIAPKKKIDPLKIQNEIEAAIEGKTEQIQKKHEMYQLKNLGQYEKIFPLPAESEEDGLKNALYESIRVHAQSLSVSHTGAKKTVQPDTKKIEETKAPLKRNSTLQKAPIAAKKEKPTESRSLVSTGSQQESNKSIALTKDTDVDSQIYSSQSTRTDQTNPYSQVSAKERQLLAYKKGSSKLSQNQSNGVKHLQPSKVNLDPFGQLPLDQDGFLPQIQSSLPPRHSSKQPIKHQKQAISNQVFEYPTSTNAIPFQPDNHSGSRQRNQSQKKAYSITNSIKGQLASPVAIEPFNIKTGIVNSMAQNPLSNQQKRALQQSLNTYM